MMTTSFSDLLAGIDPSAPPSPDHNNNLLSLGGPGPRFKFTPPPSIPMSPPSYFSIPPGAELLDSPVFFSSPNILPSPTTGTLPSDIIKWTNSPVLVGSGATTGAYEQQQRIKAEANSFSDFSFRIDFAKKTIPMIQSSTTSEKEEQMWNNQQQTTESIMNTKYVQQRTNTFSFGGGGANSGGYQQSVKEQKRCEDGYNWRKYGQKQVKGSENPRSYYKCTHPNCVTKKKVEKSVVDGHITQIVYKGTHNHPKPQPGRRGSSGNHGTTTANPCREIVKMESSVDMSDHSFVGHLRHTDQVGTPDNSSVSFGDDDFDQGLQQSRSGENYLDEDDDDDVNEPDMKRWKCENEGDRGGVSVARSVREPRVVIQTSSDIDILIDGYKWRKYGQKVVKGNPNPRSYYKCTNIGCEVRKHIERASHDPRAVITTYEGKHNHDVPAERGSGSHVRPPTSCNGSSGGGIVRPLAMIRPSDEMSFTSNSPFLGRSEPQQQAPFTLKMLQTQERDYSSSSIGNSMISNYMGQLQNQKEIRDEQLRDDFLVEKFCQ